MYILIQKDCVCELNIAEDVVNLFNFKAPYEEEELEVIELVEEIIDEKPKYEEEEFVVTFNEKNNDYEIVNIQS